MPGAAQYCIPLCWELWKHKILEAGCFKVPNSWEALMFSITIKASQPRLGPTFFILNAAIHCAIPCQHNPVHNPEISYIAFSGVLLPGKCI